MKKIKFDVGKEIRAISRERVGHVRATKKIRPKTKLTRAQKKALEIKLEGVFRSLS